MSKNRSCKSILASINSLLFKFYFTSTIKLCRLSTKGVLYLQLVRHYDFLFITHTISNIQKINQIIYRLYKNNFGLFLFISRNPRYSLYFKKSIETWQN